ncbi:FAD-binding oxidoreductase [Micromonospora sp. AP08]|uniref:FAD-binding oxidoreductase n=1 Tax=Micromonospora sp. AP08 TaxID=2604467 RepID=UPI0011D540A7|nr:FAD-dependent oxidoreductase [Micromonospora sp. AP08]TYB39206.1 FAD-binding oxidoreductase [Micromonospora sp. AP08]
MPERARGADVLPAVRPARWHRLGGRLAGDLVLPADPAYDAARRLQQMEFDRIAPLAVAYCASTEDVRTCVGFAREHGIPLRIRSGGHSHNGWSTGEALVVDLSRMNAVSVGRDTVALGPGTQSVDALAALRAYGRQIITGTFPTVAAGGFLTGGGLGWQTRRFGVGSDRVAAARVVLADGRVVRCSADEEPDLYWALRGGGGGTFGIVVGFEVRPVDAPVLVRYDTVWDLDRGAELVAAWQQWCVEGPDELGSSLVVLPSFRPGDTPTIRIWGVHLGSRGDVERGLASLAHRAGTRPRTSTVGDPEPYPDAMHRSLCGDATVAECHRTGTGPEAKGHRHPMTLRTYRLTDRAMTGDEAAAAVAAWDPGLDQERYLLFIALGGQANRVPRTETAYVHRNARFLAGYQYAIRAPQPGPDRIAEARAWNDRAAAALAPTACGSYVNFPSTRPEPHWRTAFFGENHPRLLDVKRRYDPENVFRHPQSVGA